MRRVLARLLAVALTLAIASAFALAALVRLGDATDAARTPLYFNAAPRNVHDLSLGLLQRLARGPDAQAEQELVRLGGAALPHILPALDTVPPGARARVALSLHPLARRMGIANDEDFASPQAALGFWVRYWQDRAFDFRPQVVRRLVSRLAERSSALRYDDLVQLDTYAVSELLQALGTPHTRDDVLRAERLTLALCHVTGRGPAVERSMSVQQADAAVREWRRFAAEQAADFSTLDGPLRLVAMFTQTRYGAWFARQLVALREPTAGLGIPWGAALASVSRIAATLGVSLLLAAAWVGAELRSNRRWRLPSAALAALAVVFPAGFVARVAGLPGSASSALLEFAGVSLASVLGTALLSRALLSAWSAETRTPTLPILLKLGVDVLPSQLSWLIAAVFSTEIALHRQGVAETTLAALARGDVAPGMALALASTLLAAALVSLGATTASGTPSAPPALVAVGDGGRRRWLWGGSAALVAIGIVAIVGSRSQRADWLLAGNGAAALLAYGTITWAISTLAGVVLGTLAAGGPTSFERAFVLSVEVGAALPALLWGAAFTRVLGPWLALAAALGALRALDVAWVLRSQLLRLARGDAELQTRSLGRLPFSIFLRRRLRPAAPVILGTVALTPSWILAVGVAGQVCGLPAAAGRAGWDVLLSRGPAGLPASTVQVLLGVGTWLLLVGSPLAPRRLGAARSTPPPTAAGATGP